MKCLACGKKLRQGDDLLPVYGYVKNDKRGDFVSNPARRWVHLTCQQPQRVP